MKKFLLMLIVLLLLSCGVDNNSITSPNIDEKRIIVSNEHTQVPNEVLNPTVDSIANVCIAIPTSLFSNYNFMMLKADWDQDEDYGYQPVLNVLYRGPYQDYYELNYTFNKDRIESQYVQFKVVAVKQIEYPPYNVEEELNYYVRVYK